MVINYLRKCYADLLPILALSIVIMVPAICRADADKIFKANNKAVVIVITCNEAGDAIMQGSGFIVREDGVIVTNYHVISNARSIRVKAGNRILNVDGMISLDKDNDIAILKVDAKNLYTVKLNLATTEIGERVYVISSPQGLENTISDGILSGKRELAPHKTLLQITAAVSSGSSGGPVFNKNGEVIGVVTFLLTDSQNLNFAMSVETFKDKISGNKVITLKDSQIYDYETTPEYWVNRGYAYIESGKAKEAMNAFSKAIELKPDYAEAYFGRGGSYIALEKDLQAIDDFNKAIKIDPNNARYYYFRGRSYNIINEYQKAIYDFSKAIELNPDDALLYGERAYALNNLGNYLRAIEDCSKAIQLESDYAEAYYYRGLAYAKLNNYQEVIKNCSKAIELKSDYDLAYFLRGTAWGQLKNFQQAKSDFIIAARLGNNKAQATLIRLGMQW